MIATDGYNTSYDRLVINVSDIPGYLLAIYLIMALSPFISVIGLSVYKIRIYNYLKWRNY